MDCSASEDDRRLRCVALYLLQRQHALTTVHSPRRCVGPDHPMERRGLNCPGINADCFCGSLAPNTTEKVHEMPDRDQMTETEENHRFRDIVNAAALVVQAVESASRDLATVDTPYGRADVILDDSGADVVLHDRDVTVHVRTKADA